MKFDRLLKKETQPNLITLGSLALTFQLSFFPANLGMVLQNARPNIPRMLHYQAESYQAEVI